MFRGPLALDVCVPDDHVKCISPCRSLQSSESPSEGAEYSRRELLWVVEGPTEKIFQKPEWGCGQPGRRGAAESGTPLCRGPRILLRALSYRVQRGGGGEGGRSGSFLSQGAVATPRWLSEAELG